jgi:hypothetical protein
MVVEETPFSFSEYLEESREYITSSVSNELLFPLSIFRTDLSPFRLLVKYLVEKKTLTLRETATLLGKSYTNIWIVYRNTKNVSFEQSSCNITIPLSKLLNKKLTFMEGLILYLKQDYSFSQIASMLQRNPRTIWTIYTKAKKKMEVHNA